MRTYRGLAGEVETTLWLVEQVERQIQHWGAAGIRVDGRKIGIMPDAVRTIKEELQAMRDALPADPITGQERAG